ncbi:PIN domain-containing protein [Knoellia sp. S7-12]|uniref:type II toxin-antitoxin system VapC family toxin n=1 Tax=Knoellia sp. S7-12 TaxID=3126698 RepID=UPI00338F7273
MLIGYFERSDERHDAAVDLVRRHRDQPFGSSPLTLAEFLAGPARRGERFTDDALGRLDRLAVRQIALNDDSPVGLARLRASSRLPMPDCAVLHAAQQVGGAVASFDTRLCRAAEELGIPLA